MSSRVRSDISGEMGILRVISAKAPELEKSQLWATRRSKGKIDWRLRCLWAALHI
jgi:hypothetical protein